MPKLGKRQPKGLLKAYVRLSEQATQKAKLLRERQGFCHSENVVKYSTKRQTRFPFDANTLRHLRKDKPLLSFEPAEKMKKLTDFLRRSLAKIPG